MPELGNIHRQNVAFLRAAITELERGRIRT
jgi:hypothetical protein